MFCESGEDEDCDCDDGGILREAILDAFEQNATIVETGPINFVRESIGDATGIEAINRAVRSIDTYSKETLVRGVVQAFDIMGAVISAPLKPYIKAYETAYDDPEVVAFIKSGSIPASDLTAYLKLSPLQQEAITGHGIISFFSLPHTLGKGTANYLHSWGLDKRTCQDLGLEVQYGLEAAMWLVGGRASAVKQTANIGRGIDLAGSVASVKFETCLIESENILDALSH